MSEAIDCIVAFKHIMSSLVQTVFIRFTPTLKGDEKNYAITHITLITSKPVKSISSPKWNLSILSGFT